MNLVNDLWLVLMITGFSYGFVQWSRLLTQPEVEVVPVPVRSGRYRWIWSRPRASALWGRGS